MNVGDAISLLTGGLYQATIHRVVQPPTDQQHLTRLGIVYFSMPNDEVKLVPILKGVPSRFENAEAPTVEAWRKERTAKYGVSELKKTEDGDEEETIQGVVMKHYN